MLTRLSDGNDIVTHQNSRDAVGLDRRGYTVPAELNVLEHHWVETGIVELRCDQYMRVSAHITDILRRGPVEPSRDPRLSPHMTEP